MSTLLSAGVQLMLVGMGTVFFFLTLLVFATGLMSRIVGRIAPVPEPQPTPPAGAVSPEVVAAISAAITQHRAAAQRSAAKKETS